MKYPIFFLRWILAISLEHLGDDWIVYLYRLVYYKAFYMACINYYISQK